MKLRIFLPTGSHEIDVDYPVDLRTKSQKKKWERMQRWDAGERPMCVNHPNSVVNRSAWMGGRSWCSKCKNNKEKSPSRVVRRQRISYSQNSKQVRVMKTEEHP